MWRGKIYGATGIYEDSDANINRCDSILTLNLTIKNDLAVTRYNNELIANETGATYQWIDCDSNYAHVNGATSQTFKIIRKGSYAVIVTKNSCTDTSACFFVNEPTALPEGPADKSFFHVYPNPGHGLFTLEAHETSTFVVFNMMGQILVEGTVKEFPNIDLSGYSNGMYFIRVNTGNQHQTIKLIKN